MEGGAGSAGHTINQHERLPKMEWNHVVWILTIFAYKYYSTNYSVRRQGAHIWRVKKTGTYKIFSSFSNEN